MKSKTIILAAIALMFGTVVGGVILGQARADETEEAPTCEERCARHQEMFELKEKIDREAVKTNEGIQINVKGQDRETIDKMHEIYDENDGQWGMGPGRGFMGKRFLDENGNGMCDHAEQ